MSMRGFCNSPEIFSCGHIDERNLWPGVAWLQQGLGFMGIDTLIVILLLTFGAGFILNRLGAGTKSGRISKRAS
jgi:hypothetical protein